jgi:hypothetical protein
MNDITSLKEKIKFLINKSIQNVFEYTKRETLNSKLDRIEEIGKNAQIEKYKIVFIGTVGAGKTTAISHLFNLTSTVKKSIKRGKKNKSVEVIEPLLSTGSGRTTICEVEIKSNEDIFIEIEPYSKDELIKEIQEFCESIYDKHSQKNTVSIELERAIRSIIGLKETTKQHKNEIGKTSIEKIDLAKNKAEEFSSLDKFIDYALNEAKLNDRVYTKKESKILFNKSGKDSKKWLKENFSKINRAEISHFSIPKKINVYINREIFGDSDLDKFESIIDTKGIDENPIREDLIKHIEEDNTICIFTSSYNDAPETNIRELLLYSLSKTSKKHQDKFITLVMPKNNEPEKENDSNGDREAGIAIKKEIIKKVFKSIKLDFSDDNILFYDALEFYDLNGQLDIDYDEEDIQEIKDELIENINNIIKKRKEGLQKEIIDIKESVSKIKEGKALLIEEENYVHNLIEKLKNIRNLNRRIPSFIYEDFVTKYVNYYATRYKAWNTKDAIHRRYGVFPERGYDTYYDAKVVVEGLTKDDMLQKFTKELKIEIEELIDNLGKDVEKLSDLTPEIKKVFEKEYDVFLSQVGDGVRVFLEEKNKNISFWKELIDRRGKGRGYNDDVTKIFHNKLISFQDSFDINRVFQNESEKEWEILIDKILKFFKKV